MIFETRRALNGIADGKEYVPWSWSLSPRISHARKSATYVFIWLLSRSYARHSRLHI